PANRLLAFYPRHRLTAEQIRDQALYVSGLLLEQAGGPSVKPYQPEGLWQEGAMPQSNTREYKQGKGEPLHPRSPSPSWHPASPLLPPRRGGRVRPAERYRYPAHGSGPWGTRNVRGGEQGPPPPPRCRGRGPTPPVWSAWCGAAPAMPPSPTNLPPSALRWPT